MVAEGVGIPSKPSGDPAGKILERLLLCRSERSKIEIETNVALADMEPMAAVKISLVSEAGDRRWRSIKNLQPGEQICRGGGRGINVCPEPELAAILG